MKSIYHGYTPMESILTEDACFIGANTGRGFIDTKPIREGEIDHLYILKGGAGTGKSTLMKRAASQALENGIPVTVYYCGSDPFSLDAVLIGGRFAILDGTAPHVREMKYPALSSSLLDVSRFLDGERLGEHRAEIMALSQRKSTLYQSAYRYLKAAETLDGELSLTLQRAADLPHLSAWAERTAKKLAARDVVRSLSGEPKENRVYTSSISMKGRFSIPSLRHCAERIITVRDVFGFSHTILEMLGKACIRRGLSVMYGLMPVNDRIAELYLPDISTLFAVDTTAANEDGGKSINAARFLSKEKLAELRGSLRLSRKCTDEAVEAAESLLLEAGDSHFALEQIHIAAMDFDALQAYTAPILTKITAKFTPS